MIRAYRTSGIVPYQYNMQAFSSLKLFFTKVRQRLGIMAYIKRRLFKVDEHLASIYFVNFIFQRIFGLNRDCPWPVHFTSRVSQAHLQMIHPSVYLSFAMSGGCYIQAINGLEIGEGTIFASGVKFVSANHSDDDLDTWEKCEPIRIGKDCWIGANAVILPGVQLGDHVIVGAGSVVTKSFSSNCVVAGVPAKIIKQLKTRTKNGTL